MSNTNLKAYGCLISSSFIYTVTIILLNNSLTKIVNGSFLHLGKYN